MNNMAMGAISDRIKSALDETEGKTQAGLARACSVSSASVSDWVSGKSKGLKPANLVSAARYLNVRIEWLATGELPMRRHVAIKRNGSFDIATTEHHIKTVPLIGWASAASWSNGEPGDNIEKHIPVTSDIGQRCFALRVTGDSMEPEFAEGALVIVDPDIKPSSGQFVIAGSSGHSALKLLTTDGGREYLAPLNNRYPVQELTDDTQILGVVVCQSKEYL